MKKLLTLILFFMSANLPTEEYYLIKKQDYENLQHLYSQLGGIAIETGTAKRILPIIQDLRNIYYSVKKLNNFNQDTISFSNDIDWDIIIKVLEEISGDFKTDSQERQEVNKSITYLRTKIQNEIDNQNKLTLNEKLSIMQGRIDLLEMGLNRFMKIK